MARRVITKRAGENYFIYGQRWVKGESIRALATEAGIEWPKLQAKLRELGFLRSHVQVLKPTTTKGAK